MMNIEKQIIKRMEDYGYTRLEAIASMDLGERSEAAKRALANRARRREFKKQRLDILQKVANGELTPEQADKQLLGLFIVGVSLPIESFDVDDWLGLTYGVWYHPFIELHNYDNGDKKSIELAQIIADYANSIIQQ